MIRTLGFLAVLATALPSAGAADRFVVITDSHGTGHWGAEIASWLRRRPETTFELVASGGSAPRQWLRGGWKTTVGLRESSASPAPAKRTTGAMVTPALADLWQAQGSGSASDRRITVIAHGTNFHHASQRTKGGGTYEAEDVDSVAKLIAIAQRESDVCVWIGPPKMRRADFGKADGEFKVGIVRKGVAKAAKETGKPPCALVDAREFSEYPAGGPDGIHYNYAGVNHAGQKAACARWAKGTTDRIERILGGIR